MCEDASEVSRERVGEWLNKYMFQGEPQKGGDIAAWLGNASLHKSHGRPIGIDQARSHGLKVTAIEDDQDLQELLLSLFHATTITFEVTNCVKLIENHLGKGTYVQIQMAAVAPPPGSPPAAAVPPESS